MYRVRYGEVTDLNVVDWEYAAAKWAIWRSDSCDADVLVQQSAERLKLVDPQAYIWQEGMDEGPVAPRDFLLYTPDTDRPIVVALKGETEGAQPVLFDPCRSAEEYPGQNAALTTQSC